MKHTLTVVPLGPGDPALLTLRAADLLRSGIPVVFRTSHHPVAAWLTEQGFPFSSLDALYESAEDFDAMNHAMVQSLLERVRHGDLLYAVPDPLSDRSVSLLLREAAKKADVRVLPGVSLVDTGLAACRGQLDQSPYQTVSAADFSAFPWNPSLPLLITELDSQLLAGEVKLKLNEMLEDQTSVFLLPPSGGAAPVPLSIPLWELDRRKRYDQTVSLLVPGLDYLHRRRFRFEDLVEIMSRLRGRDGCPWDADQTHLSLRPYLVEEAWEAVDAIDHEDMDHLADELGDVLLQVVFHASIGASFDEFTCTDVMTNICRKMMQRHPQLFQEAAVLPDSLREPGQSLTWEEMKQRETGIRLIIFFR